MIKGEVRTVKKIISLTICFLLVFTLCMPVFADEKEPTELEISDEGGGIISVSEGDNYIISSGDYYIDAISVNGGTLTIGKDARIEVDKDLANTDGKIIIHGILNFRGENFDNCGEIHVGCVGMLRGLIKENGTIINDGHVIVDDACTVCGAKGCELRNSAHTWNNGVCTVCGKECTNSFHSGEYKCPDCGLEFDATAGHTHILGSVFSGGSLTAIVGIAAAIIFGCGGFVLGRKNKPAMADGSAAPKTEEEDKE